MSISELKRFLFVAPNFVGMSDLNISDTFLKETHTLVKSLVNSGKGNELLAELTDYFKFYSDNFQKLNTNTNRIQFNLDTITFVLASCSVIKKDEQFQHKVYSTLGELALTPVHLFAFEYYRKYLFGIEENQVVTNPSSSDAASSNAKLADKTRRFGRGQTKCLSRWYNQSDELQLLRLLTQFKHGYTWSNKDILKLIHMKPKTEGINLIFKYILFGFDKIKNEKVNESEKKLFDFITDLENLKTIKSGEEAANIIKKHKLSYDHIPAKTKKYNNEIWPALVEQMNLLDLCTHLNLLLKKEILTINPNLETFILNNILNNDNNNLKSTHPIFTCLAVQIYEKSTSFKLMEMMKNVELTATNSTDVSQRTNPSDKLKNLFWEAFLTSVQYHKSLSDSFLINSKIMVVIDINGQMRNDFTDGLNFLSPIDTGSCIMLTLYYMNQDQANVDLFAVTEKLNQIELIDKNSQTPSKPDLNKVENIFKEFASSEKNPSEKIFEWSLQNKKYYDAFVFLSASDINEKIILNEMNSYRTSSNNPNSRLIMVNLTSKLTMPPDEKEDFSNFLNGKNLNLNLSGWTFDSFFTLYSFLSNKF